MGRAFEYRKEKKMKRWGAMAKAFTKIGKEIAIAIKEGGGMPETNPRLRLAIQNAKKVNMPKANVDAAIKRGTSKDTANYEEVVYEGYAQHGIAVFVETLTDNPTRTVANVRSYFTKTDGKLGTSGSLASLFTRKSFFRVKKEHVLDMDELELEMIDAGLEEFKLDEDEYIFYAAFTDFGSMQKFFEDKKIEVEEAGAERIPNLIKQIDDDKVDDVIKLIDKLEDDDDVINVFHNMDMN